MVLFGGFFFFVLLCLFNSFFFFFFHCQLSITFMWKRRPLPVNFCFFFFAFCSGWFPTQLFLFLTRMSLFSSGVSFPFYFSFFHIFFFSIHAVFNFFNSFLCFGLYGFCFFCFFCILSGQISICRRCTLKSISIHLLCEFFLSYYYCFFGSHFF